MARKSDQTQMINRDTFLLYQPIYFVALSSFVKINPIMKYHRFLLLIIVILTFSSCSQNAESSEMTLQLPDKAMAAPQTEANYGESLERKLIKEGRVEFETSDMAETRRTVTEAVKKNKSYVSSDQEYKSPGRISNTVVIRVPANQFDQLLKEVTAGVEKYDTKEIHVRDITEEFVDIEARLKTKKELEQRYIDLLKQAKNVTEIVEIEKQANELRTDIESVEGRLKYLQNNVAFSTLSVTFYENVPHETVFGQKFRNGFRNGWDNLIWFFVMLVNIWPFVLLGILAGWGIRRYRRRKR